MQGERNVILNREHETPSAEQLVADASGLLTPPLVCVKMFELVNSAHATADDIGEVVALDPNLAARLLRIVNSSYYSFQSAIDNLPRAVTILGSRDLYNLVLAITAVRSFSKVGAGLVQMEAFWQHSVFCALLARQLGKHYEIPDADRLFVAGLLHDVGISLIYSQLPQLEQPMQAALSAGESALHDAEFELLGFSHATIGALVLKQWQLPDELCNAVNHHHDPGAAKTGQVEAAIVHLADALADRSDVGALWPQEVSISQVDEAVWDALGDGPESLDEKRIVSDVSAIFGEAMRNLMPSKKR